MNEPHYQDDAVTLYHGDCLDILAALPDNSVDSVVTDPPYGLEFMGKDWDAPWKDSRTDKRGVVDPTKWGGNQDSPNGGNAFSRSRIRTAAAHYGGNPAEVGMAFQQWCQLWAAECLRVLKPGGHLLAFGGTRTWHRLACAVEDAGFEIRDNIAWLYGSGFPKSMDVSKAIDKQERGVPQGGSDPTSPNHGKYRTTKTEGKRWSGDSGQGYGAGGSAFLATGGAEKLPDTVPVELGCAAAVSDDAKRWAGWGTALKPAFEPVVVARKPLAGTVAGNVLAHGVGALNIDGCRVATNDNLGGGANKGMTSATRHEGFARPWMDDASARDAAAARSRDNTARAEALGRWPSNVVIDGHAAQEIDRQSDEGGASRFFPTFRYQAKAAQDERPTANGIAHPTVKPLDLMRWLVRLVTPPGGLVLEPFAGSGTTAEACIHEHMKCVAIEREADYLPLIVSRLTKPIEIGFDFDVP